MSQTEQRFEAGRAAVVTGGGAGIGQGIAVALARRGCDVTIVDIDPERAEVTAGLVHAQGRRALVAPADVRDGAALAAAVEAGHAAFGRTDVLVNNAGGTSSVPFLQQDERKWRRLIDLNLTSALVATATAVPRMIDGGRGGAVVNVVSIEASRAAPSYAVYAGCKAALVSLTRTWALEFAEHAIRVNAIAPDITVTPGIRGQIRGPVDPSAWQQLDPAMQAAYERYIPLGREGDVAECGEVAAFLCSDAAAYVTGVTIPVDGGTWASSGWNRRPDGQGWALAFPAPD